MNRRLGHLLSLALIFGTAAKGAVRIEMQGEVLTGKEKIAMHTVLTLQKGKMRLDSDLGQTSVIFLGNGETLTAIHPSRTFLTRKIKNTPLESVCPNQSNVLFKKTASNVTVGGLVCDEYEIYEKGRRIMEMCVADLVANNLIKDLMADASVTLVRQYLRKGKNSAIPAGLPARMVSYDGDRVLSHLEISRVERPASLADTTFTTPAGYRKLNLNIGD